MQLIVGESPCVMYPGLTGVVAIDFHGEVGWNFTLDADPFIPPTLRGLISVVSAPGDGCSSVFDLLRCAPVE